MDYKEKLKEALNSDNTDYEVVRWIEQNFPELKESEGEKIRKAIIEIVKKDEERIGVNAHLKKIQWLEKQGEQKNTWSEEDEEKLNRIISLIHCYTGTVQEENELKTWLKSLKERYTWKPSDEQMGLLQAIVNNPNNASSESCQIVLKEVIRQLKKLTEK